MKNKKLLRDSIISACVKGQITYHKLNDKSAFDLINSIHNEHIQLLTNHIIHKQKNDVNLIFKDNSYFLIENDKQIPIDQEIIDLLPANWGLTTQKELFWLDNGVKSSGESLPILDANFLRTRQDPTYANSGVIVTPEDRVILVDGENSGEVFTPHCKGYLGSTFKILKFTKLMNYDFLLLILKSSQEKYRKNKTGMAIPHLNKILFRNDLAMVPPLEEQNRIVAKMKELEPLIEQYEKEKEKRSTLDFELLQKLRLSILKAAIEGNLTQHNLLDLSAKSLVSGIRKEKEELIKINGYKKDKDAIDMESIEKPFVKPTNWEWIRLGDLGFFKKGPFGSDLTKDIFVDKGKDTIKVYEQQNAINKDWKLGTYYITKDYYDKKMYLYKTDPGDIIVSCVGTIGEAYLIPNDAPSGIINTALLRIKLTKKINVQYFLLYFDCVLKNLSNKLSKGVAVKGIPTLKKLTNMLVAIPPLEEQEKIVEKVKNLYSKIDELLVK